MPLKLYLKETSESWDSDGGSDPSPTEAQSGNDAAVDSGEHGGSQSEDGSHSG
jgi:hypothetical protein